MVENNIHFDVLERKDTPTPLTTIDNLKTPYTWDYRFYVVEFSNDTDFQATSILTDSEGTVYTRSDNVLIHANETYPVITEAVLVQLTIGTIIRHCQHLGLKPENLAHHIDITEFDDSKREHLR